MSRKNNIEYVNMILLVAFEILLTFTAFGYFNIKAVSLTLVYLPVLVAAYYYGVYGGLVLGSVYGIMSIWGASISTMSQSDQLLTFSMTSDVMASLVLGIASRIAFGITAALLFKVSKRFKRKKLAACTAAAAATICHNIFVYGTMYLFFRYMTYRFYALDLLLTDIVPVVLLNSLLMFLFFRIGETPLFMQLTEEMSKLKSAELSKRAKGGVVIFFIAMLLFTASLVCYFLNKIKITFSQSSQIIPYVIYNNCMHLGIQFVLAIVSLLIIICYVVVFFVKMSKESERKSELDPMTRIYNKAALEKRVNERLAASRGFGRLIMIDVDDFKKYNDTYGHLCGDYIILQVAEVMQKNVTGGDVIGRLGGDEFCMFLTGNCDEKSAEDIAAALCKDFLKICVKEMSSEKVTCSIGISSVKSNGNFRQLYHEADEAMYAAKKDGKSKFVFYEQIKHGIKNESLFLK